MPRIDTFDDGKAVSEVWNDRPTSASPPVVHAAEPVAWRLTAYEAQVLIGTTMSGRNMAPDGNFNLKEAWSSLHDKGLIDRRDGLAVATKGGEEVVAKMLGRTSDGSELLEVLKLASNKFAFAAGLADPLNKDMFLRGAKTFCDEAIAKAEGRS